MSSGRRTSSGSSPHRPSATARALTDHGQLHIADELGVTAVLSLAGERIARCRGVEDTFKRS
jgi:hypothetical protein